MSERGLTDDAADDGLAALTRALTEADTFQGRSLGEAVLEVVPGMAEQGGDKMSLGEVLKRYGAAPLLTLSAVYSVTQLDQNAFATLAPDIAKTFDLKTSTLLGINAASAILVLPLAIPFAVFADRGNRTRLAAAGAAIWAVFVGLTCIVTAMWQFAAARILTGIGQAAIDPVHGSLLADYYPVKARSRVYATHFTAYPIGGILGPILAGVTAWVAGGDSGWRWAFAVIAPLGFIVAFLTFLLPEPERGAHEREGVVDDEVAPEERAAAAPARIPFASGFQRLMEIQSLRYLYVGMGVLGFAVISGPALLSLYFEDDWGVQPLGRGLIFAIASTGGVVGLPLGGIVGDRLFRAKPSWPLFLMGASIPLFTIVATIALQLPSLWMVVALYTLAVAVTSVAFAPLRMMLSVIAPPALRSLSFAMLGISMFLVGGLAGGIVLGAVSDATSPRFAYSLLIFPGIIAGLLVIYGSQFVNGDIAMVVEDILEVERAIERQRHDSEHLLEIRNLDFRYGSVQILFGVDLDIPEGEIFALLGTNGAGKSTLLRALSGLDHPIRGSVRFHGEEVTYLESEQLIRDGIVLMPGGRAVFPSMTVEENLRIGAYTFRRDKQRFADDVAQVYGWFPILSERRNQLASTLSGGEQQMLGLSRAFLARPTLLCIDELSLGLSPVVVESLFEILRTMNARGTTILIVEQSVNIALGAVDHRGVPREGPGPVLGTDGRPRRSTRSAAIRLPAGRQQGPLVTVGADTITLGVINGLTYAMMAMGIVLIYRASRFVNFAQAQIGAIAVVIMAKLVLDYDFPYWAAVAIALLVGLASGALIELTIVRRLFKATRLVLMMATIGAAQVLLSLTQIPALQPDSLTLTREGFPVPSFPWNIRIGLYLLRDSDYLILIVVPLVTIVLASFLRWSAYGRAIRAASDNADLARLSGISVKRMSTLVWLVAALLSTIAGILLAPRTFVGVGSLSGVGVSFGVLVRAFGAALFGRMTSLVQAFAAAIAIGIIESIALASFQSSADTELVIFLIVVAALLVRARDLGRASRGGQGESRLAQEGRELPREVARLSSVRRMRYGTIAVCIVLAVIAPFLPILDLDTQSSALGLSIVAAYAIAGLSVCLLTGWGGQVSLGQFALVGVGAFVTARLVGDSVPMPLVFIVAGIVGAIIAVAIGLPALRIQGLYLALTTLSFAVLATVWLFTSETFVDSPTGSFVERPELLRGNRAMYFFSLAIVVIAVAAVTRYRRAGPGRLLIAVRDNDRAARSWGISATRARVVGFLFSGFIAAVAGVVFAYGQQRFDATTFPASASVNVLALAIVGGLATVSGALLGAIVIIGPAVLLEPSPVRNLLISGLGLLLFLMYVPGGIMSAVLAARDALAQRLARRELDLPPPPRIVPPIRQLINAARGRPVDVDATAEPDEVTQLGRFGMTVIQEAAARREAERAVAPTRVPAAFAPEPVTAVTPADVPALQTIGISLNFGGVRALDDVSITVGAQETVGLIGANGAGKTTLLDCISGYHRSRSGRIVVFGHDMSSMSPTRRALAGVGRSYQDARLFPGLTVEETLLVAFEPHHRTRVGSAMLGLPAARRRERAKRERVGELIEGAGLIPFRDKYIGELSTGTRRVVDIVSILAQRPRLLLLDEPASGIAQAETEALGPLLRRMQAQIGCAILVIEHDMPLIAGICDRLYALEAGRVIAEGEPQAVLTDDAVVASYLGGDQTAIARSGARSGAATSVVASIEGGSA